MISGREILGSAYRYLEGRLANYSVGLKIITITIITIISERECSVLGSVKLSSPWINFYREIEALFKDDPDIKIDYNDEEKVIKLFVDNDEKADALMKLLPTEKSFGNVVIRVQVVPANDSEVSRIDLFRKAFEGNPVFSYAKVVESEPFVFGASYVVFKNRVVQYFNDDLSDVNGLCSTLYQYIAEDVFGICDNTYFSTEIGDDPIVSQTLKIPLGEWP